MEDSQLTRILGEKDQMITNLQNQIVSLKAQLCQQTEQLKQQTELLGDQSKQIGILTTNVQSLNTRLADVFDGPTTSDNYGLPRFGKRPGDPIGVQQTKNQKSNPGPSVNDSLNETASSIVSNSTDEVMDQVADGNTNTNVEHNPTLGSNEHVPKRISNWAEMVEREISDGNQQKPTPIQLGAVTNDNYDAILNLIYEKFDPATFEWIQLRQNASPRIVCSNGQIKAQLIQFLINNGIEYNTYAEKTSKRKAFIVRGLIHGNDDDNIRLIQDAVNEYHIGGVISINRFMTPHMKRNNDNNTLFQLVLSADADDSRLALIKSINSFRIKFEKMHNSKVVQCHRCQRFSHTATSCGFNYRCVQCTQAHGPGNCPRKTNKKLPIGCVNCLTNNLNHVGHTANDIAHCPYYAKIQNRRGVNATNNAGVNARSKNNKNINNNQPMRTDRDADRFQHATIQEAPGSTSGATKLTRKERKMINKYRPNVSTSRVGNPVGKPGGNASGPRGQGNFDHKKEFLNTLGVLMELARSLF